MTSIPADRVKVARELDGVSFWHYDSAESRYYRYNSRGEVNARIRGVDLPDPFLLEKQRMYDRELIEDPELKKKYRVKSSPVTRLLWEHWQGVNNG